MKAIYLNDVARGGWQVSPNNVVNTGKAAVYRLEPPLGDIKYVFVSTATVLGRLETYAFASDEKGEVSNWCELEGSMKGDYSHEDVLAAMGYKLEPK